MCDWNLMWNKRDYYTVINKHSGNSLNLHFVIGFSLLMMKTWSILIEFIYDNKYIKSRRGLSEAAFLPLWEHFQFIFIIISAAAAILDQCVGHLASPSGQSSHVASSTGSVVTYVHVFQWGPKGSRAMDSRVDAFSSQFEWVTDLV